eukprot:8033072-Pyramimonas_sp.AAC.1
MPPHHPFRRTLHAVRGLIGSATEEYIHNCGIRNYALVSATYDAVPYSAFLEAAASMYTSSFAHLLMSI